LTVEEKMATLKERYKDSVVPELMAKYELKNIMTVPRITKVVVNMGIGISDKDHAKSAVDDLTVITGQKAVTTKARKSISNFKLREGMVVGAKVTLRRDRMYEFLERLISAALPRIRDFRGVSPNGFDGRGNFTMGIREQTIFPEIDPNHSGPTQGMDITIVTTARNNEMARTLLDLLGMPFSEN